MVEIGCVIMIDWLKNVGFEKKYRIVKIDKRNWKKNIKTGN